MIAFICGLIIGVTIAFVSISLWITPILDEARILIGKLKIEIAYHNKNQLDNKG